MRTVNTFAWVFVAGALAVPTAAHGQGLLTGIVTDTLGHPLQAHVRVQAHGVTVGDESGAYLLRPPPGTHDLEVELAGFEPFRARVEVTLGDRTIRHVVLEPAPALASPWRGCALDSLPADAACLDPRRVDARSLWVEEPGQWRIDSAAAWEEFWQEHDRSRERPARDQIPEINWDLNLLILVGRGTTSGCTNRERYVNRILLYPDSTVVFVGPEGFSAVVTCMMVIAPVDAVQVPRGYGPIRFRSAGEWPVDVGGGPEVPPLETLLQGPTFTPFTEAPSVLNRDEVVLALQREYPAYLRDAAVGGTVRVHFLLDDEGQVLRRVIDETSGNEELDAAALRAARVYRFSPARNLDQPVYAWLSLPITFTVR